MHSLNVPSLAWLLGLEQTLLEFRYYLPYMLRVLYLRVWMAGVGMRIAAWASKI